MEKEDAELAQSWCRDGKVNRAWLSKLRNLVGQKLKTMLLFIFKAVTLVLSKKKKNCIDRLRSFNILLVFRIVTFNKFSLLEAALRRRKFIQYRVKYFPQRYKQDNNCED